MRSAQGGLHMAEAVDVSDRSWMGRGKCLGMNDDPFFPERGASAAVAKEACRACPVQVQCLEYALATNEDFGIWGGTSARERSRILRRRRLRQAS